MATIVHKRGDTFTAQGRYKAPVVALDGTTSLQPQDLSSATVTAQIKTSAGVPVATLTYTMTTPQSGATLGMFTLSSPHVPTESWPLGAHQCDIQFTFPPDAFDAAGRRQSTDTFIVRVVEDITT